MATLTVPTLNEELAMQRTIEVVLRRSYEGGAWHGPSLAEALAGIDARAALARPIAGAHTIWELTHHLMAWTREVTRRLETGRAAMPAEGDWPEVPSESEPAALDGAWSRLRASLDEARDALLATLGTFPPERLDVPVAAIGEPVTYGQMLIALAEHNAYHGGQAMLLRRALDGTRSPPPRDPDAITES
jgi:uncharacterized damage-inducible protein DinB